jgi:hypothetical protein
MVLVLEALIGRHAMRQLLILFTSFALASSLLAQSEQQGKQKKSKKELPAQIDLVPHEPAPIFTAEGPIAFTITANYDQLRHDRKQEAPWRWASVTVTDSAEGKVELPLKVRTRGIWRMNKCDLPPLRLDFVKSTAKQTVFAKLDKPKLVMHCRDNEEYEQYVLQEFQLYRIYNLLTKYSNRVRLARVTYADSGSGKVLATRWAFLEEEPDAVAYRVGGMLVKQKGAGPADLEPNADALFALFEYFIGNTDWSVNGLHNVELIDTALGYIPVAYDFDFSGAVNARYATTDPSLPIHRVRDRLYRGYCVPDESYAPAFELFNAKKDSIYALYRDSLGQLLKGDRVKETLEYFDDFYKTIKDPRVAKHEIKDRCLSGSR